jgi:hypothetical protein
MAISSLTKEVYEQLLKEVDEKTAELKKVKETEPIDMYKLDLTELKKSLKNIK